MTQIQLFGAGKETQTPGLFLGKEALYQLSYTRIIICFQHCKVSDHAFEILDEDRALVLKRDKSRYQLSYTCKRENGGTCRN